MRVMMNRSRLVYSRMRRLSGDLSAEQRESTASMARANSYSDRRRGARVIRIYLQDKKLISSGNPFNRLIKSLQISMTRRAADRAFAAIPCELEAAATISFRRLLVDVDQFANAIPAINNIATIAAVACVLPTYFLRLSPVTYRVILSLGVVCGLSMLGIVTAVTLLNPLPHPYLRFFTIELIIAFSPFTVGLIAALALIGQATRVGIWSTAVLFCVVLDWIGISILVLTLRP
jgi:hypothetical protein